MDRNEDNAYYEVERAKLSQNLRTIGNAFYMEMKQHHVGKENTICGDAIAMQLSVQLGIRVTKFHIWKVAKLLVRWNKLSVCSWVKGYYVDESFGALRDSLRFLCTQYNSMKQSITDLRNKICKMYGENVIPDDIEAIIDGFEEEDYENYLEENEE